MATESMVEAADKVSKPRAPRPRVEHDSLHMMDDLKYCWCMCSRCWARTGQGIGICICSSCPCPKPMFSLASSSDYFIGSARV